MCVERERERERERGRIEAERNSGGECWKGEGGDGEVEGGLQSFFTDLMLSRAL